MGKHIFYFIVILICNNIIGQTIPLSIKENNVIGLRENEQFLNIIDLEVDNRGLLFVSDKIQCIVKVFDEKLNCIYNFGKKGKNPSEFKSLGRIAITKDYIIIADFASSRFQIFDKTLFYIKTLYAPGPIIDIVAGKENSFFIGAYTGNKDKTLFEYQIGSFEEKNIILKSTIGDLFKDIYLLEKINDELFVAPYLIQNKMDIFNKKCENTIVIKELPKLPQMNRINKLNSVPKGNLIRGVAIDIFDNIYILLDEYCKLKQREILVYSIEKGHISTLVLPEESKGIYIDSNNKLYSIINNRTLIKTYDIKYENK